MPYDGLDPVLSLSERNSTRQLDKAVDMIKRQRRRARLSMNRRRVKPRSRAREIVDKLWINPSRDFHRDLTNVYFVRTGRYIKIGKSTQVSGRLAALQCAHPEPLELLGTFCGISCDEVKLHHLFISEPGIERAMGEWFTDHPVIHEVLDLLRNER